MKFLFALVLTTLFCSLSAQTIEKTYLTTDKEIYAPEDTLWFKGYVFDERNLVSDQSISFNVLISDQDGNKINDTSWPIISGLTHGNMNLPLKEGKYYLVAFTGKMMNLDSDLSFKKEIYVRSSIADQLSLSATASKNDYQSNEPIEVKVHADLSAREVAANKRLEYHIYSNREIIEKRKFRTDENGDFTIRYDPEESIESDLNVLINDPGRDLMKPVILNVPIRLKPSTIDLQFLPEGGHLINGINSRIAFKALDKSGNPIDIKGVLLDQDTDVIDTLKSDYLGMGSFYHTPSGSYSFKIIEPTGIDSVYKLPPVLESGVALAVTNDVNGEVLIKISSSPEFINTKNTVSISQHGTELLTFSAGTKPIEFFPVPLDLLDVGIVTIGVKNSKHQVLSERLFFAKRTEQLNIQIATNKTEYAPREKIELNIKVTDSKDNPIQGNFSLAAIDQTHSGGFGPEQPNLMAQILLKSELTGEIPTPNFYFSQDPLAEEALDLVMLTHGWRKYDAPSDAFEFEGITGQLLHRKRKKRALSNSEISIFSMVNLEESTVKTDKNGRFFIGSEHFKYRGDSFLISSKKRSKDEKPNLIIDSTVKQKSADFKRQTLKNLAASKIQDFSVYLKNNKVELDRFQGAIILNKFTIARQRLLTGSCDLSPAHFESPWRTKLAGQLDLSSDRVLDLLGQVSGDVKEFGEKLWVQGSTVRVLGYSALLSYSSIVIPKTYPDNDIFIRQHYLVSINCDLIEPRGINYNYRNRLEDINFKNIESISLLKPFAPAYLERSLKLSRPGFILLNTIDNKIIYRPMLQKFFTHAIHKEKNAEFYGPKYVTEKQINSEIPDLRTTIHWQHTILTDESGQAKVSFFNADRPNKIRVTIEGLGIAQRFGFREFDYWIVSREGSENSSSLD